MSPALTDPASRAAAEGMDSEVEVAVVMEGGTGLTVAEAGAAE